VKAKAKTSPQKARTSRKSATPRESLGTGQPKENPKLAALKRAHFTKKGRAERIARARKALEAARWDTGLDLETIKWIAEDPNLEYM
jgi:hypothetical protein